MAAPRDIMLGVTRTTQDIVDEASDMVLAALDAWAQKNGLDHGWKDGDLPRLLPALQMHARSVLGRSPAPERV